MHYGPRLKAAAVHLTQHHLLQAQRTADLMGDLTDLPLSDATVLGAVAEARERLEPTVTAIGQAIVAPPIAPADETVLRVEGKLHWLQVLAQAGRQSLPPPHPDLPGQCPSASL